MKQTPWKLLASQVNIVGGGGVNASAPRWPHLIVFYFVQEASLKGDFLSLLTGMDFFLFCSHLLNVDNLLVIQKFQSSHQLC